MIRQLLPCLMFVYLFCLFDMPWLMAGEMAESRFRGPVGLVASPDQQRIFVANQLSGTVSMIDVTRGVVVDEIQCGTRLSDICTMANGDIAVVGEESGEVVCIRRHHDRLEVAKRVTTGFLPHGVTANATSGDRVYVSLMATGEIAEVDVSQGAVLRRFYAGQWPRYLALTNDGQRLAVGLSGESCIAILDVAKGDELYREPLSGGINLGHMRCSKEGQHVYFPWMIYRTNPINVRNIRMGWVLASRAARVRLDGPADREAISLDVPGMAVADPFGIALTEDEHRMVISSSGTHELLVYRLPDVPFMSVGGPGDLIDEKMLRDKDLFYRIELGGRPMGLATLGSQHLVAVANYTLDCVQIVDLKSKRVTSTITLGKRPDNSLEHRGMEIFYDARKSLDQWYSCHSCHLDGGSNAKAMDTWNDGTPLTPKTVLSLYGVADTSPWTWHGWQNDLDDSIRNSFQETMQGKQVTQAEVEAVRAFMVSLRLPKNPFLKSDGSLDERAARGKQLFESNATACATCHQPPTFSDGDIHDVGLGAEGDKYKGFNTPSLLGLYRRARFLHDGRAKTLEALLQKHHGPQVVSGGRKLTDEEVSDLVAYLKTL